MASKTWHEECSRVEGLFQWCHGSQITQATTIIAHSLTLTSWTIRATISFRIWKAWKYRSEVMIGRCQHVRKRKIASITPQSKLDRYSASSTSVIEWVICEWLMRSSILRFEANGTQWMDPWTWTWTLTNELWRSLSLMTFWKPSRLSIFTNKLSHKTMSTLFVTTWKSWRPVFLLRKTNSIPWKSLFLRNGGVNLVMLWTRLKLKEVWIQLFCKMSQPRVSYLE